MKFKSPLLAATALAAAALVAPVAPVSAAPAGMTSAMSGVLSGANTYGNVINVKNRKRSRRHRRGHRRWRGHRGSRHWRPGYRRHNGWWFPLAAFGALAAGAAAANAGDLPPEHYRWCDDRYRSYDPASDTFQPYEGPRKRCNSPYDGY